MHSGGRKLHQLMVIADCPLRSLANGGLYVRDEATAACPLCFCYADRQIAAGIVHNASPSISISSCVPLDRMRIPIPPLLELLNDRLQRLSQLG